MCECDVSAGGTGFTDIIGVAADSKFSRAAKLRKMVSGKLFVLRGIFVSMEVVCSKRLRLDFFT